MNILKIDEFIESDYTYQPVGTVSLNFDGVVFKHYTSTRYVKILILITKKFRRGKSDAEFIWGLVKR